MGQNVAEFFGWGITGGKTLSVNLAQRSDEGVAMLVADFAVVIAVAIVEAGLAHAALPDAHGRQLPPAAAKWQLMRVRDATAAFSGNDRLGSWQRLPHPPGRECRERGYGSNGNAACPSCQSMTLNIMPRLSISVSRSAACFFQSDVSLTRNLGCWA